MDREKKTWTSPKLKNLDVKETESGFSPGDNEDVYDFDQTPSL